MINYIWKITDLLTVDTDDKPDYVVFANYKVEASEDNNTVDYEALISFKVDEGSTFIPYSELTNDLVISWVKSTLGNKEIAAIEKSLADIINSSKKPSLTPQVKPLPW
jgi:hypothetical protein